LSWTVISAEESAGCSSLLRGRTKPDCCSKKAYQQDKYLPLEARPVDVSSCFSTPTTFGVTTTPFVHEASNFGRNLGMNRTGLLRSSRISTKSLGLDPADAIGRRFECGARTAQPAAVARTIVVRVRAVMEAQRCQTSPKKLSGCSMGA